MGWKDPGKNAGKQCVPVDVKRDGLHRQGYFKKRHRSADQMKIPGMNSIFGLSFSFIFLHVLPYSIIISIYKLFRLFIGPGYCVPLTFL